MFKKIMRMLWAFLTTLNMKLMTFRDNRRGIQAIVLALVVTLVSLAVILPVGLLATSYIRSTIDAMDLGTSGNATRTTLFTNIYVAFDLSAIVPIIAGAALVIGVIIAGFTFSRRGG